MTPHMVHATPGAVEVPADWHESQDNVLTLIGWLADQDYFDGDHDTRQIVRNVVHVIERPTRYADEYRRMLSGLGHDEEKCPACGAPGDADYIRKYECCSRCDDAAMLAESVVLAALAGGAK